MTRNVGVWLDHENAMLVTLSDAGEKRRKLSSEVERHTRAHGGGRSANPQGGFDVSTGKRADRRRSHQIKSWFEEIVEAIGDADRIYLGGPGEAKREFLKNLEKRRELAEKVVGMDSAPALTENQWAAMVRDFYGDGAGAGVPEYRRAPGS